MLNCPRISLLSIMSIIVCMYLCTAVDVHPSYKKDYVRYKDQYKEALNDL